MASVPRLHEAVRQDKCRLVAKLISEGTNVDALDSNGNTALFNAITDGSLSAVPYLLLAGANPNFRCSGQATPVHAACKRGSRSLLQQLLECGGDLRLRDERGRTPQDWAVEQSDPQCRRKLLTFINTKRAIAYRFDDPSGLLEDEAQHGPEAALLRRRLGRVRKLACHERLKADGGFGVVYCSPSKEMGASTFIPFISSIYLYSCDESMVTWSGPQSVIQTMYWDKLKVSVKKSSLSGSNYKGPRTDVLVSELENIRKITYHSYFLWPLAVSPVQNMDDVMLVFELVQFGSLYDVLHNSPDSALSKAQQVMMVQQACEALLFLHSRRLLHGCLSSHSIYAVTPFVGKLGGFEFLCHSEEVGKEQKYVPPSEDALDYYYHWMAPEVLAGRQPTRASDLYQMCVVLWELFTDEIPWENEDRSTVYRQLVQERNRLYVGSEIPSPLGHLVEAGLAPSVDERDTDLEEVYQVLSIMVHENYNNASLSLIRRDSQPKKKAAAKSVFTGQEFAPHMTNRSSAILDNASDTVLDDLISLDDDSPKFRRQRMDGKLDGISVCSSVDAVEYGEPCKASRQDKTEAFTQTDSRPPRPRTGVFAPTSSATSIRMTKHGDAYKSVTKASPPEPPARLPRPIGFVSQPNLRRNVRQFKPASHKCELSPFMHYSQMHSVCRPLKPTENKSSEAVSQQGFQECTKGSQGDFGLVSRKTRMEDFREESEEEEETVETSPKVLTAEAPYPSEVPADSTESRLQGGSGDYDVPRGAAHPHHHQHKPGHWRNNGH
ncbi:inactive serine/threonine-protein kinase TEX14-like isoform X2 [Ornithodoros turicata]|uniref:inactive serine/threonine-protein kinase TEX14-like isoform X2 n=1 Tax=Ornithodoros turicata TaxID=34597 RepID=UPI0031388CC4